MGPSRLKPAFVEYLVASAANFCQRESQDCSKLTSEQAGMCLRQESVDFPDLQKVAVSVTVARPSNLDLSGPRHAYVTSIWSLHCFVTALSV